METILIWPVVCALIAVSVFLFSDIEKKNDDTLWLPFLLFVFSVALLGQGFIGYGAAKKEAIKTGNAYYAQVVDKDANVKNVFHWKVEEKK